MKTLTISQLGEQVGLPTKTIRFYEESGVISPPKRGENGYRLYPESAVKKLYVIKQARDLGLPISEIKKLMIGCNEKGCEHTQQYLQTEISNYILLLRSRIAQFTLLKEKLEGLQSKITDSQNNCAYCCNILHQLTEESKGGEISMNENCSCCGSKCECKGCSC